MTVVVNGAAGTLTGAAAVLTRNSDTALAAANIGRLVVATGTFTQTFAACSALGNGWAVQYRNGGTGIITLDPNGGETIDGQSSIKLYKGESCTIYCDGSNLHTVGRTTGMVLIESKDITAGATNIDFTQGITDDFNEYVWVMRDVRPSGSTNYAATFSTNGGTSYAATGYSYTNKVTTGIGGETINSVGNGSAVLLSYTGVETTGASCELRLFNPANTTDSKKCTTECTGGTVGAGSVRATGAGLYFGSNSAVNAVRFTLSAGSFSSGSISMYGVRK